MYTTVGVGSSSRLILIPTFAIVVVILVRHRITKIRLLPTIVSVMFLWLFSTIPNLLVFSPKFWMFTAVTDDQCSPYATSALTVTHTFAYITVYGLCSLLITTVSTIYGIVHIKRNTISQDRSVLKNMIKFATFLLLGNTISFIGTSFVLLIGTFPLVGMRHKEQGEALVYVQGVTVMRSLIPPLILLFVFFKPMRMRICSLFCFVCYKIKDKITSTNLVIP